MDEVSILRRLKEDVINFDADDIREAASLAMEFGIPPEKAINEALAEGMEEVGERYRRDEYFLPDLVMAAEAMNEATKVLFPVTNSSPDSKATVVIATVEGDIHDIGKNILANFLAGAGIVVHDLGVDVSNEEIIEIVKKLKPKVLGLSSMITTTSMKIKGAIEELERNGLRKEVKVIVGGTSLGRLSAKRAGADAYARDAVEGVRIIDHWIR